MNIFNWIISAILIENVVLVKFLGTCPFLGVSKDKKSALGMGLAVTLVITLSSLISWLLYKYLLVKFDLIYILFVVDLNLLI